MPHRLELFLPVSPHTINQPWGVYNAVYKQFGFSLHNGVDLALVNGQEIYAPFDCTVIRTDNQPNGGGIFAGLLSDNVYSFDDGVQCRVLIDFLHCQRLLVKKDDQVNVGELVALGDNTGFSTGSHTHMQCRRVRLSPLTTPVSDYRRVGETFAYIDIDRNDANNSFDPVPYFSPLYAKEYREIDGQLSWIRRQIEKIKSLFKT